MAKKKKAKTKTRGTPQRQIKIVVPGGLHVADKKVLQKIADLLTAAGAVPTRGKSQSLTRMISANPRTKT